MSMLTTYLQDHHAGATAGLELARRTAGSNRETTYGPELARIAEEIAEDKASLERVMERLGVKTSFTKDKGAWAFEKVGRLKPNNRWLSYSPLSRLLELEGLLVGVTGKLGLWESLRTVLGSDLDGVEFERLAERARDQRDRIEQLRIRAAGEALSEAAAPAE